MTKREEIEETKRIAEEVSSGLQGVLDPRIDALDEDAPDEVNRPQLLGMLVGVRHFIGSFKGAEVHIVKALDQAGISRECYMDMCRMADTAGVVVAQLVVETMPEDDQEA